MGKKDSNSKVIQFAAKKEINQEQTDLWNLLTGNFFLKKKDIFVKENSNISKSFPELIPCKKEKVALVLGGGGARGLAHIGIIRELEKYDVEVDFIAGTSMGSIVGALYALEGNVDLIDKFVNLKARDIISLSDISLSFKGFLKGHVVEDILQGLYGNSSFKDTKIDLVVNAVDVETGKERIFKNGKLIDAVRASMSIPMVFQPKMIDGKLYVDGGVVNNLPYDLVPKKYKKVIVCNVTSQIQKISKATTGLRYFRHFISVLEHNATKIPNDKRVIYIAPETVDIYTEEFHKINVAIERGRKACKNTFARHFKLKKKEC